MQGANQAHHRLRAVYHNHHEQTTTAQRLQRAAVRIATHWPGNEVPDQSSHHQQHRQRDSQRLSPHWRQGRRGLLEAHKPTNTPRTHQAPSPSHQAPTQVSISTADLASL